MRILGIDPGLATVGLGLITAEGPERLTALDWLTITTKAGQPLQDRLIEIDQDLTAYLSEKQPNLAVVEQLYFSTNEKTALQVAQARGVILCCLARQAVNVLEISPLQLKAGITGDGRADKKQMQTMLMMLLNLPEPPTPDDAADALALAVYGGITRYSPAGLKPA